MKQIENGLRKCSLCTSLSCISSLTSWCFFSPSHFFKLRHRCYYTVVTSTLELSFLHITMVYITALCRASRQFTAVRHYPPSLDTSLSCSCNQPGQLRAAGRSGCQLTFGASWRLLQSAKGLVSHCKVPAMPPIVRDFYSSPANPLRWNGKGKRCTGLGYQLLSPLRKTFHIISFTCLVCRPFMTLHQPNYKPHVKHSIVAFMIVLGGVKTKISPFPNLQPGKINTIIHASEGLLFRTWTIT